MTPFFLTLSEKDALITLFTPLPRRGGREVKKGEVSCIQESEKFMRVGGGRVVILILNFENLSEVTLHPFYLMYLVEGTAPLINTL